jgi:hypothetical protein
MTDPATPAASASGIPEPTVPKRRVIKPAVPMTEAELNTMWGTLVDSITSHGNLVVLLGAGANKADRNPEEYKWIGRPKTAEHEVPLSHYAPDGTELCSFLVETAIKRAPGMITQSEEPLPRVAQRIGDAFDLPWLQSTVRDALDADYTPTVVHSFLARLPQRLRAAGKRPKSYPFIITTNYDDVLECAFEAQQTPEPYDTVVYAPPGDTGSPNYAYVHYQHGATTGEPITVPGEYERQLDFRNRTVILKIHGATTREQKPVPNRPTDYRFVLAEDEYVDFLSYGSLDRLMPVGIKKRIRNARFLFLGYSLLDWNIRVFIRQRFLSSLPAKSYAIQLSATREEIEMWQKKEIRIHQVYLEEFIAELDERVALACGEK